MIEIAIKEAANESLSAKKLSAYTGMYSPDLYLNVALSFDPIETLANVIDGYSNFKGWMGGAWPEDYVPIAVMDPSCPEDEETYMDASGSDAEEFYAINQSQEPYSVYCWNHDVGFEKRFETVDAFLENLVKERP